MLATGVSAGILVACSPDPGVEDPLLYTVETLPPTVDPVLARISAEDRQELPSWGQAPTEVPTVDPEQSYHQKIQSILDASGCTAAQWSVSGRFDSTDVVGMSGWNDHDPVSIQVGLGLSDDQLVPVVTHQCIHHLQGQAYGNSYSAVRAGLEPWYPAGTDPVEANVECAMRTMGFEPSASGDLFGCDEEALEAGRAILNGQAPGTGRGSV